MEIRKYQELCVKDITGSISEVEKQILGNWLKESGENKLEYDKLKNIWDNSSPVEMVQLPDIDMEWQMLDTKIHSYNTSDRRKDVYNKLFSFIHSLRIAALKPAAGIGFAAILLIIGIYVYNLATSGSQLKVILTANTEQRIIQLSDGSTIFLNTSSKVQFPEKFDREARKVYLKGEAFFSVSKNKTPFIVITDNARTRVLGTKFNVKARNEKTEVFVKEGRVNLSQNNTKAEGVDLTKGQFSAIVKRSLPARPKEVNVDYLSGWMQGRLVYDQTPLNEILVELERYYDVKLQLNNPGLKNQTLTGSFKNHNIDSVLSMICLTMDLDYERSNEGYIIKSK